MSESRLDELEARYTQLEHTLSELSEVVWRQQRELDLLHEQLGQLRARLGAEPGLVDATRQEKPPHY
jgi:SlyX protein